MSCGSGSCGWNAKVQELADSVCVVCLLICPLECPYLTFLQHIELKEGLLGKSD